jgi:hypothetical protein
MSEEDVRILLSILHDLFPEKTMRVVTHLTPDDVTHFCKRIDLSMPLLKAMLHDRIGEPIPYEQ